LNARNLVAAAAVIVILVVGAYYLGSQLGTTSSGRTTTTVVTSTMTGGNFGSPNGLQLQLTADAASTGPSGSVTLQIRVSEYNTLATENNVTKGNSWSLNGLSLGECGTTVYPFGVSVYRGNYNGDNASSAKPLQIYPAVACSMLIRYITGYLFQPSSSLAVILPGGLSAIPTPMSANVTANAEYFGGFSSSSSAPLAPGTYTLAAGDEWGSMVFVHVRVGVSATTASGTGNRGTLMAALGIGPTQPVCSVNATTGPASSQYSSIQAVITSQSSGQTTTLPVPWVSNGCSVSASLQASLAPGSYSLNLSSCQFVGCSRSLPRSFVIATGQTTSIAVSIDTGIR